MAAIALAASSSPCAELKTIYTIWLGLLPVLALGMMMIVKLTLGK
jgi:hypothetical protein